MANTPIKTPQDMLEEQRVAREKAMAEADAQMAIPPTPTQAENDAAKLGIRDEAAGDAEAPKAKPDEAQKASSTAPSLNPAYKNRDLKSE